LNNNSALVGMNLYLITTHGTKNVKNECEISPCLQENALGLYTIIVAAIVKVCGKKNMNVQTTRMAYTVQTFSDRKQLQRPSMYFAHLVSSETLITTYCKLFV
jgi:hypothetical protein